MLKPSSHGFGGSEATQLCDRIDALSPVLQKLAGTFATDPMNVLPGGLAPLLGEDAHEVARAHVECRTNKPRFPTRSGYSCDDEPAPPTPQPRTGVMSPLG